MEDPILSKPDVLYAWNWRIYESWIPYQLLDTFYLLLFHFSPFFYLDENHLEHA